MKDSTNYNWLKYILIPVFALLFLQVGRPMPLWGYLNSKNFYFDLIFAILICAIVWRYIQVCYQALDIKTPWYKNFKKRAGLQVLFSGILPIFLMFGLYIGYMKLYYGSQFRIERSLIFQVDLILGVLLIVIMNLFFVVVTLLVKYKVVTNKSPQELTLTTVENTLVPNLQIEEIILQPELQTSRQPSKLLVANGSKYTLLQQEEMQYIKLQNGIPVAYLKDGTSSVLNTPLNSLDEILPDYFFRVNRNAIVNLREVKGFVAEKSGKLILKLKSENQEEIVVSQNRSVAFKDKLLSV